MEGKTFRGKFQRETRQAAGLDGGRKVRKEQVDL